MRTVYLRVLVGAVGAYALAKASVIAADLLFLLIQMNLPSRSFGLPQSILPVMVGSFLALGAVGFLLLLKPPKRILSMLAPPGSSLLGSLLAVLGLLIMVVAMERLINQIGYASRIGGRTLLDILSMLVPVLIALGALWLLRAPMRHRQEDLDPANPLPPQDVWHLAAVMVGLWTLYYAEMTVSSVFSAWRIAGTTAFMSIGFHLAIQLMVGIYLVIGAPGLVRWHLDRIEADQPQDDSAAPVDSEN